MYNLMITLDCGGTASIDTDDMEILQEFAELIENWQNESIEWDDDMIIPVGSEE